ncbi:MAG: segregation/condensation protein A [Acidobacteriota bacterium]
MPVLEGRVKLDLFEGPLDLLLYVIRRSEIDIHDIPIAKVTEQYQGLLERAREDDLLDLDFAGDYFLLAATLIQIKTRMLLPRTDELDGEAADDDPRRELVQQLLEYERFKEAAMLLRERADVTSAMHSRPDEVVRAQYGGVSHLEVDLLALARAFGKVMEEKRARTPHVLEASRFTVGDRIRHLLGRLRALERGETLDFTAAFEEGTVEEAVVTFLALLELVKRGFLCCQQPEDQGEIQLTLAEGAEDREDPGDPGTAFVSEFDQPPRPDGEEDTAPE